MIELRHVKKSYPNITPLLDVNAEIHEGDVIAIIGPSGCGKSTLLRLINLLEKPTAGSIIVDGVDITAPGYKEYEICRKIGMVFQNFNLFSHLTVLENVMIPRMDLLEMPKTEAYEYSMQLLHMVGMDGFAMQYPNKLSGGQKQRVAIARTLALDPEIILFDEPTSALDPTMVGEVESVIRELAERGRTMMIVTHEMRFAREISNRVFYMDEGGIYEDGTPEQIFDNPQKTLTKRFIQNLKVLEIVIDKKDYDFPSVITKLEQYGQKNQLEKRQIIALQSIFEELCQAVLLEHNPDYHISFTVEYNEKNNNLEIVVKYNGDFYNPQNSNNAMSMSIVMSKLSSYKYSQNIDGDERNIIVMKMV